MITANITAAVLQVAVISVLCLTATVAHPIRADAIRFVFYDELSEPLTPFDTDEATTIDCSPDDKLAIIVHGWHEGCFTPWIPMLVKNLRVFRGGCIVCMDYSHYAQHSYYKLLGQFDGIADVLANGLEEFWQNGLQPERTYVFGFSFGAQLVLAAGRRVGEKRIHQIDACDPAGPGFDHNTTFQLQNRPQASAQNVQCIHTSYDKGTTLRNCHQNWNMGKCGWVQTAARTPPFGSHGLCPYFYVDAFEAEFRALDRRPIGCPASKRVEPAAEILDEGYFMGYDERRNSNITGDFYANTYKCSPFNEPHECFAFEKVVDENKNTFGEIMPDTDSYAVILE